MVHFTTLLSSQSSDRAHYALYQIHIEPVGLHIDLESAILLYNLAIAHIHICMSSNDDNKVEEFRQTSLKLLEMVCSLTSTSNEDNFSLWPNVANLFVLAAAMKNMAQVLSGMGKSSETQSHIVSTWNYSGSLCRWMSW
jgi:hypothetical protein